MNIFHRLLLQAKKPAGHTGTIIAWLMNFGHSNMTNWGLNFLKVKDDDRILDIGCGGGRTINKLIKMTKKGKVYGIDYSDVSIKVSSRLNRDYIKQGRVQIQKSGVSSLPFPDNYFDIITAIETYFLWPNLENDMREVLRVLKPEGKLLILSEIYKSNKHRHIVEIWSNAAKTNIDEIMHFQTKDEFEQLIISTGYENTMIYEKVDKGWICGIGTKPLTKKGD